jgi:hypothetical protein
LIIKNLKRAGADIGCEFAEKKEEKIILPAGTLIKKCALANTRGAEKSFQSPWDVNRKRMAWRAPPHMAERSILIAPLSFSSLLKQVADKTPTDSSAVAVVLLIFHLGSE